MAKITLSNLTSGFQSTTVLNANFDDIEDELQNKVLYRNNPTGEPNEMNQDLDMNGYNILNLGNATVLASASVVQTIAWGTQFNGSGTHSLSLGNVFRNTEISSSETATVYLVTESVGSWQSGSWMLLTQRGPGKIKVNLAPGVTLRYSDTVRSRKQYSRIGLSYRGSDIWYLYGDVETTV